MMPRRSHRDQVLIVPCTLVSMSLLVLCRGRRDSPCAVTAGCGGGAAAACSCSSGRMRHTPMVAVHLPGVMIGGGNRGLSVQALFHIG
jgi:hypothetical protein